MVSPLHDVQTPDATITVELIGRSKYVAVDVSNAELLRELHGQSYFFDLDALEKKARDHGYKVVVRHSSAGEAADTSGLRRMFFWKSDPRQI